MKTYFNHANVAYSIIIIMSKMIFRNEITIIQSSKHLHNNHGYKAVTSNRKMNAKYIVVERKPDCLVQRVVTETESSHIFVTPVKTTGGFQRF